MAGFEVITEVWRRPYPCGLRYQGGSSSADLNAPDQYTRLQIHQRKISEHLTKPAVVSPSCNVYVVSFPRGVVDARPFVGAMSTPRYDTSVD